MARSWPALLALCPFDNNLLLFTLPFAVFQLRSTCLNLWSTYATTTFSVAYFKAPFEAQLTNPLKICIDVTNKYIKMLGS